MLPIRTRKAQDIDKRFLHQMISDYCLQFGEVTLASGEKSNWYFNMKNLVTQTGLMRMVVKLWYDELVERDIQFQLVGGPAVGALIPAASLAQHAMNDALQQGRGIDWPDMFYYDRKDHGDKREIHGLVQPGDQALIVEDVVTSGGSILAAAEALKAKSAHCSMALAIIDREAGGAGALAAQGINLYSIFKKGDFDEAIQSGLAKLQG